MVVGFYEEKDTRQYMQFLVGDGLRHDCLPGDETLLFEE